MTSQNLLFSYESVNDRVIISNIPQL
jgi:hypothetical protein